jgi:hypothetical protein
MTSHLSVLAKPRSQQYPMPHSGHHILNRYTRKCFYTIEASASHVSILDAATAWLREQCQSTLTWSQALIRLVA